MTIRPIIAWYDLWVGAYWDRERHRLYVLPLPCVGLVIPAIPDATTAVWLYRQWIERWLEPWAGGALDLSELAGHNLACWCALDQPCHADVLLEIINEARR